MTEKCTAVKDEQLSTAITEFTHSVKHYIELILDYRNVPAGDSHKNKRMGCMLNLLVSVCGVLCVCTQCVCVCVCEPA